MLYRGPSIRSFHDLQFDLRAMLRGLHSLEYDGSVVTFKWSDGSVDKVPTEGMVKDFTGNVYPSLLVGGTDNGARIVPNGYLDISSPVSVLVDSITMDASTLDSCNIKQLVARVLVLGRGVKIVSLTSSGNLSAITIKVEDGNLVVSGECDTDVLVTRVLDTTKGTHTVAHVVDVTQRVPASSYVTQVPQTDTFSSDIAIDGRMKTYYPGTSSKPYTEVYTYAPYVENGLPFTMFPVIAGRNDIPDGTYPKGSLPDLALLYPYKQFGHTTAATATLTYKAPASSMQYMVVSVRNVSYDTVRACNAWAFNQDTYAGARRVKVTPMNYVDVPPLSAIDFIFSFSYSSNSLYAYMLPTKVLK